ncbi:MAG TPA: bL17 family ribosomal protein [Eubacteriales bacterium]|nr:bL17 family ribosomal protein [Clostridia bacterium]HRV73435.1 bL17 family ribosomal protein [Eubacteriales bacterium]
MANRKLGRTSDQRVAMLRSLTTALIWNGKIVTTETRAKEVRAIAERIITLAVKEYGNSETVEKQKRNEKDQISTVETVQDLPSKLHARRQIMSYLYDAKEHKAKDESKSDYRERTADRRHAVIEKLFRDIAPKYAETNKNGGYTRMYKLGPRRGDAAPMVVIELV